MGVKRGPVGITLGSILQYFPVGQIEQILIESGRKSQRIRKLPSDLMVYWTIAFGLFLSEGCREVLRRVVRRKQDAWFEHFEDVASESAISQARTRLGSTVVQRVYETLVGPLATRETMGAWYRRWRVVSLDGTSLDVADTPANVRAFRRPGVSHGSAAYPQLRFVSLLENATHILFGAKIGGCRTHEAKLARTVLAHLPKDSLCLADRAFFGYPLWCQARQTGAELLWRLKQDAVLQKIKKLPDGSYLTKIYPSVKSRKADVDGVSVRLIEYTVTTPKIKEQYRLLCSILDHRKAPAIQLAHLYNQRWTIETVFAELKTTLRGKGIVLRGKTPAHVKQEVFGILMAHFGVRALMLEAALSQKTSPSELSFVHAIRVVHRYLPLYVSFPPSIELVDSPVRTARGSSTTHSAQA